ncbi:MAG: TRAP transporter large permease subunit [Deltaproteobacteria bacterium]|nr:TRAP transporter large permease subunit [Deltaproteobacteria bacterium]
MERLYNVVQKINTITGTMSGAFIMIMCFVVTYEVIMRYLFKSPTTWVLEISIYLNIACIIFASSLAMQEKMHIMVDVVTRRFSRHNQCLLEIICLSFSFIFCLIMGWKGIMMLIRSVGMREVSATTLHVPMAVPYSLVPIAMILLLLELFCQITKTISEFRNFSMGKEKLRNWLGRSGPALIFLALTVIGLLFFLSRELAWIGVVLLLFLFIFGGMPIVFATGLIGLIGFYVSFGGGAIVNQAPVIAISLLDSFVIAAIPLFVMLAMILNIGKIGALLFEVASTFLRHFPGGIGVATMASIAIFSAISGSTSSTVATFSLVAIPELLRRGYDKNFSYGIVATGAVLDPLIPPSILMILIGAISGDSVGALYLAGVFPGILLGLLFSGYIVAHSWKDRGVNKIEAASWKERWNAVKGSFWGLMAPVVILGGIYAGIFTPTESAAVGVLYSLCVCLFAYRTLTLMKFWQILLDSGKLSCIILFICIGSLLFGQVVLMLRLPNDLLEYLGHLAISPMIILVLVLFVILILGALMDEVSILLICWPTLYYIFVKGFGFDPIWFSVVFLVTLEVGLVAPPVGMNIFVLQGVVKDAKFDEVVKGVMPFLYLMLVGIVILIIFKPISTWLPSLMFRW